jgi:hypothetical protein
MRGDRSQRIIARPILEALEPRVLLDGASPEQAVQLFSVSPALFVENQGQWADPSVRFVHNGDSANVAMTDTGPVFQVFRQVPREGAAGAPEGGLPAGVGPDLPDPMKYDTQMLQFSASFLGASTVAPVGLDLSDARFNYFVGDQANWRSDVPAYEKVAYEGLYDGIDLVTQGQRSHLKYEFHVAPGADWQQIQVQYEGIEGLSIGEDGSLRVALGGEWGDVVDDAPVVYQMLDGQKVSVAAGFRLIDSATYAFALTGPYDLVRELVIDPDLAWSTYLGGSADDRGWGIVVDASGNVLVTGATGSSGWTSGGFDTTYGGGNNYYYDAFVAKLSPTGGHIWSTYLGGDNFDYGRGIAVDASGNVLVTGDSSSSGWTSGGFDTTRDEYADAFVAKLSPTGSHIWSTYLGGGGTDFGNGIAVDASGNVLVTGDTGSPGWTSGGFDTTYNDSRDAFVAKLSPTGGHIWSTYLGGSSEDSGHGIVVDASRNILVTGYTRSSGWTSGGFDTTFNGGFTDTFVAKISPMGGHIWSTYLGGSSSDCGYGIAEDASGNVLVTGYTGSPGWTSGGFDTTYNGGTYDAFIAKLSPMGGHIWSTYLGGSGIDYGYGIAEDASGNVLVTGYTGSPGWTSGGFDTTYNGGTYDAFIAKLSPMGGHIWSTYLGGSSDDYGYGIAEDASGNVLVTGYTYSSGWTSGGFDTTYNGGSYDAFVAKIANAAAAVLRVDNAQVSLWGNIDDYDVMQVVNNGHIYVLPAVWNSSAQEWDGGYLILNAATIYVDATSSISADAAGFSGNPMDPDHHSGGGPGHGQDGGAMNGLISGSGGGYGGWGGSFFNTAQPGLSYADDKWNVDDRYVETMFGSAGGNYIWTEGDYGGILLGVAYGGRGGGYICLQGADVTIDGTVSARGQNGALATYHPSGDYAGVGSGGGSGGQIVVNASNLALHGAIDVTGGNGSDPGKTYSGGGGAGGRIKILQAPTDVAGAAFLRGGGSGCAGMGNGDYGTLYIPNAPASIAPTALALLQEDDTGTSNSDNLTKINRPRITGTATANSVIRLYEGSSPIGSGQADGAGRFTVVVSTTLSDGVHVVTATAQEPGYHSESLKSSASAQVTVDTQPPVVSVPDMIEDVFHGGKYLDDNITSDASPTFQGTTEADCTWGMYVDGNLEHTGLTANGNWEWTINPVGQGTHQVGAKGIDAAGNESAMSGPLSVLIDLAAPVSSHAVNGGQVTLAATDTGGSGLNRIRYRVGSQGWITYSGPFAVGAGDSVEYYASDIAGNEEDPPHAFSIPAAPSVVGVALNPGPARTQRGVGGIDPSGIGVRTIAVTFSEAMTFTAAAVTLEKVTFDGNTVVPGDLLAPSVTGSGTTTMTLSLASTSVGDTWVEVKLKGDGSLASQAYGIRLDGESKPGGSGRGYIFSPADLPTGDGAPGGDAVFFVGSLRGDFSNDGYVTTADKARFMAAWNARNLDADFRGVGFGVRPPDGRITLGDIDGFTSVYLAAVAAGRHLDPLPTGALGQGAGAPGLPGPSGEVDILSQAAGRLLATQPAAAPALQAAASTQDSDPASDPLRVRAAHALAAADAGGEAVLRI